MELKLLSWVSAAVLPAIDRDDSSSDVGRRVAPGHSGPTEEAKLQAVIRDLAPRVLRYCLGRSGLPETAEDAAQDALSALVDRWRRHGPPEDAEAFVFTVARRRLARRLWRQRLLAPIDDLLGRPDPSEDPEDRAAVRHELAAALEGLDRLRPKLKEALLLVTVGEMSTEQAAKTLGVSPSAIKMRVARARQQLKDHTTERSGRESVDEVRRHDHGTS